MTRYKTCVATTALGGYFFAGSGHQSNRFLDNWYVPAAMISLLGILATGAEMLFGLLLLVGWCTRTAAILSGLLLTTFGMAMTLALGIKVPLNFAVLTGIGGALLLANCDSFPFSVDELSRGVIRTA